MCLAAQASPAARGQTERPGNSGQSTSILPGKDRPGWQPIGTAHDVFSAQLDTQSSACHRQHQPDLLHWTAASGFQHVAVGGELAGMRRSKIAPLLGALRRGLVIEQDPPARSAARPRTCWPSAVARVIGNSITGTASGQRLVNQERIAPS